MSHYCDCDYCDGSDPEDRSISEKIASRTGDKVQQIVEDLLPVETKALGAKLQMLEQQLDSAEYSLIEIRRKNRQLERDSGKPYVEQNQEISRLNCHVANLEAAKVENEELRAKVQIQLSGSVRCRQEHQEECEKFTRCYTDARRAYEGQLDENKRLVADRTGALLQVAALKEQLERYEDDIYWEVRWRKEAKEGMKEALMEVDKLKKQLSGAMMLEESRTDLWGVINDQQIEIRKLKTRLDKCAHYSDPKCELEFLHCLNLIHGEAQDA